MAVGLFIENHRISFEFNSPLMKFVAVEKCIVPYTVSQRTSTAFLAVKKTSSFISRHHGTKHHTC
jgi:hypothetical protein